MIVGSGNAASALGEKCYREQIHSQAFTDKS